MSIISDVGQGLANSVVGIIGCGNIGISVAEMLGGFKLSELLYTSRRPKLAGTDGGSIIDNLEAGPGDGINNRFFWGRQWNVWEDDVCLSTIWCDEVISLF